MGPSKYNLKNYMEEIVEEKLEIVMQKMDICKCEKCKKYIMAIALNKLPPMYVVTEEEKLIAKLNILKPQKSTDVVAAIMAAIEKVGVANHKVQ